MNNEKEIVFYQAIVNAWIGTNMERDKLILTISSGGIGLLVTLMSISKSQNCIISSLYLFSSISFIATIFVVLKVFHRNADYLKRLLNGNEEDDKWLILLDKVEIVLFTLGIITATVLGITTFYLK